MNIAEVLDKTVEIKFEYDNGKGQKSVITSEVREDSLSPKVFASMVKLQKEQDADGLVEVLTQVVVSWDLDYNGEPFPPTFENISKCPMSFLNALIEAVAETWQGNGQKPSNTQNGSAASAK